MGYDGFVIASSSNRIIIVRCFRKNRFSHWRFSGDAMDASDLRDYFDHNLKCMRS